MMEIGAQLGWLRMIYSMQSVAILSLRTDSGADAFGLLVLGSPDPARFTADMATDFLEKIGNTTGAALTCLLD